MKNPHRCLVKSVRLKTGSKAQINKKEIFGAEDLETDFSYYVAKINMNSVFLDKCFLTYSSSQNVQILFDFASYSKQKMSFNTGFDTLFAGCWTLGRLLNAIFGYHISTGHYVNNFISYIQLSLVISIKLFHSNLTQFLNSGQMSLKYIHFWRFFSPPNYHVLVYTP